MVTAKGQVLFSDLDMEEGQKPITAPGNESPSQEPFFHMCKLGQHFTGIFFFLALDKHCLIDLGRQEDKAGITVY